MKRAILSAALVLVGCGLGEASDSSARRARQAVLSCPASPAKEVFTSAMCLCGDYTAVGHGVWVQGGSAGINGRLEVVGHHQFSEDATVFGNVSGVGNLDVVGTMTTNGAFEGTGHINVGKDLVAAKGVMGVGHLTVKGTLRTPEAESWTGFASVAAKGPLPTLGGPPCACGADKKLDVAAKIADARTKNDNKAAGISLKESIGDHELKLGSGSYFFDGVSTVGHHKLTVDGAVALYVNGDFETVGHTSINLTPGSTLDMYIAGDVSTVGHSTFGEGGEPGSVRVYFSGKRMSMVGQQKVVSSVYAPEADLDLVGDSTFAGAVFVKNVTGVGQLNIKAAGQKIATPNSELCTTPTTPAGGNAGGNNGGNNGSTPGEPPIIG